MPLGESINMALKEAMLGGDKTKAETLRGLKSAILYEAVALGIKDQGLNDEQIQKVLARESKKRAEAAELFKKGGNQQKAEDELNEKSLIDGFLPEQMDEDTLKKLINKKIADLGANGSADMGRIIGAVRAEAGASTDGALIARLVKQFLDEPK